MSRGKKKVAFNENPYEQEFYSKFIKRTEWDPKREIIWENHVVEIHHIV